MTEMEKKPQHLYRQFNDGGDLLYVGISLNAFVRTYQHSKNSDWFDEISNITLESFPDRESVIKAEREAILNEHPKYNKQIPKNDDYFCPEKEESRELLLRRLVYLSPTYSISSAASCLNIPLARFKRIVNDGIINSVKIGERKTRHGIKDIKMITGWQLIDFIEQLENNQINLI